MTIDSNNIYQFPIKKVLENPLDELSNCSAKFLNGNTIKLVNGERIHLLNEAGELIENRLIEGMEHALLVHLSLTQNRLKSVTELCELVTNTLGEIIKE